MVNDWVSRVIYRDMGGPLGLKHPSRIDGQDLSREMYGVN